MKYQFFKLVLLFLLGCVGLVFLKTDQLYTQEDTNSQIDTKNKIEGTYKITGVIKKGDIFRINFKRQKDQGKVEQFFINTRHIHYAIQQGKSVDLEALIMDERSKEASQVLVNLDTLEGVVPVWILSFKEQAVELEASKFLKMHVPSTDFRVY